MNWPHKLTLPERLDLSENDDDNARRLLSEYGEDLLYVDGRSWAVWDGLRYSFEGGALAAFEVGSKLRGLVEAEAQFAATEWEPPEWRLRALCRDQPRKYSTLDEATKGIRADYAARLKKHAVKCGNVAKIEAALKSLAHRRRALVEDLDRDPFQFICANGQVDLLTARKAAAWGDAADPDDIAAARASWLKPAVDRSTLPTRAAGFAYDPAATCPQFEAFLELICPDPEVRACLWRIIGAMLFGENRAQACVIIRGPGGNGKSTLLNALQAMLGTRGGYAATCKIDMFLETGFANAAGANPEEVDLPGARCYIATEPGARDVMSAKKIKGLTGGDRRMSRGLFSAAFFWTPSGLPVLSCNRTPKIKDEDEGTRRRLVILPLEVNLRALPPDRQLSPGKADAAFAAEAPGIFNRALEAFAEFWEHGIAPPAAMDALKNALMESADPVGVFLSEMTVAAEGVRINVTEFYKVHERWCEEEGRTIFQMKTVGDIMVEKGHERGKYQGRSTWRGITWAPCAAPLLRELNLPEPATAQAAPADVEGF